MVTSQRIDSGALVEAGLAAMRGAGKPLTKIPSNGRSMIYGLPNGETVRLRTCNDHVLIIVSADPTLGAKLNIQGTDWILIVMPEVERTEGRVLAYLVPTAEVETEARRTHQEWLSSKPKTRGANTTWNLWFKSNGPAKANNYALKWAKYRVESAVELRNIPTAITTERPSDIKSEVENARRRVAEVAGVAIEAVKITINFEG